MGKSHPWRWPVGFLLRRSGRERVSTRKLGDLCASAPSLQDYPMPSRMTQESYRPGVSDRTMVGNSATTFAYEFQRTEWRRHESEHETLGWERASGPRRSAAYRAARRRIKTVKSLKKKCRAGWIPREHFWLPAQGEVFFA